MTTHWGFGKALSGWCMFVSKMLPVSCLATFGFLKMLAVGGVMLLRSAAGVLKHWLLFKSLSDSN